MINPPCQSAKTQLKRLRSCSEKSEQVYMLRELVLATHDHLERLGTGLRDLSLDHSQPVSLQSGLHVDRLLTQYRAVELAHPEVETHTADIEDVH